MKLKSLIAVLALATGFGASAQQPCTFSLDNIIGTPGSVVGIEVPMNNGELSALAYQCDVVLPAAVQVVTDKYGNPEVWPATRTIEHTISSRIIKDDANPDTYVLRVICYSLSNVPIPAADGAVFGFNVQLGETYGSYPVTIDKIHVTGDNLKENNSFTCPGATVTIASTSAIESMLQEATAHHTSYDLQGRAIPNPAHGVYILDGKKVLVK